MASPTYGFYEYPSYTLGTSYKKAATSQSGGGGGSYISSSSSAAPQSADKISSAVEVTSAIQTLQKALPKDSTISYNPHTEEFRILLQTPQGTKEIVGQKDLVTASSAGLNNVVTYAKEVYAGKNPTATDLAAMSQGRLYSSAVETPAPLETIQQVQAQTYSYGVKTPLQEAKEESQKTFMELSKRAAAEGTANISYDLGLTNPLAKSVKLDYAGFALICEAEKPIILPQQGMVIEPKSIKETTIGLGFKEGIRYQEPLGKFQSSAEAFQEKLDKYPSKYIVERYERDYSKAPIESKILMLPVEFGLGVGTGFVGLGQLGYGLLTAPGKTVEEQVSGIPSYVQLAKERPVYIIGQLFAGKTVGTLTGGLVPKLLSEELKATGKAIGKEIEPMTSFASDIGKTVSVKAGELVPKEIKLAKTAINEYLYGANIKPQQMIRISDLNQMTEGKTELGSTRTSMGSLSIQEVRKTKGTVISGIAEGQVLVLQFEKPVAVKTVVSELIKTGSELNTQIRQFTGVAVRPLIKELKKSGRQEIESISIPFKVKGVGFIESQGLIDRFLGQKKVYTFPIRAKASAVAFPEIQKYTQTTPMTFMKNIGEKYQLSLGRFRANQRMGLSAGKAEVVLQTPQMDIFQGVARFREYKSGRQGKISQIIKVEKAKGEIGKGNNFQFIENPDQTTSTLAKISQQTGTQVSANIQAIGEKYTKGAKSGFVFSSASTAIVQQKGAVGFRQVATFQPISEQIVGAKSGFVFSSASTAQVKERTAQKAFNINLEKSFGKEIGISLTTTKTKTGEHPITLGITKTSENVGLITRNIPIEIEITIEKTGTQTRQTMIPFTSFTQKQTQRTIAKTATKYAGGFEITPPPEIPEFYPTTPESKRQIAFGLIAEETGYNVYARSKGNFQKLNKKPLSRNAAMGLGGSATDNSAAATFKIKKTNKAAQSGEAFGGFNAYKFQQIQANPTQETFREKNTFRIDTQGEIQGISAKGWVANRQKAMMNSIGISRKGKAGIMGF